MNHLIDNVIDDYNLDVLSNTKAFSDLIWSEYKIKPANQAGQKIWGDAPDFDTLQQEYHIEFGDFSDEQRVYYYLNEG
ncbi:MAG: hypothetical protein ACI86H_002061 [bacterium]|jgi:hypothetical protein